MALVRTITLELHLIDVTHGEWCPRCALPSGVVASWVAADQRTLRAHFRGRVRACECGWQEQADGD